MNAMGLIWASVILITVFLFALTKFNELKHKYLLKLTLMLVGIFLASAGYVYWVTRPDLTTYTGFLQFGKDYASWVGGWIDNAKEITSYAIKQNWGLGKAAGG